MKKILPLLISGLIGGIASLGLSRVFQNNDAVSEGYKIEASRAEPVNYVPNQDQKVVAMANFSTAATRSVEAVVHVKSMSIEKNIVYEYSDPFQDLFGLHFGRPFYFGQPREQEQVRQSSGSGVIISPDGYIVTNNHVIEGASALEIVLNDNRKYHAEVVGKDPSSDLALLKIDEKELPHVNFEDSDNIKIGDWVLAVGNPFNLSSTVTAGIVSAKARNLNLLKGKAAIESFIQTDAAVNPGNSGGALVNMDGKLIGINTAIATPTGAFAGYSFAIPANIVSKVVNDLKEFGMVQRAFIGAELSNINNEIADELGLSSTKGVYIQGVAKNGAASLAGIREGDVILAINGLDVATEPQLMEKIAAHRPGDEVMLTISRDNKKKEVAIVLQNEFGKTGITRRNLDTALELLGVDIQELDGKEIRKYGLEKAFQVTRISKGLVSEQTNMQEGFVFYKVNNQPVGSIDNLLNHFYESGDGFMLEGFYPGYYGKYYYAIEH